MTRVFATAAIFAATMASAEDARVWPGPSPSSVVIGPPTVAHATATVTFINTTVHNGSETFAIEWSGIEVHVQFEWQADGGTAERITVTPPPGYIAMPDAITVPEDETGLVQIVKYQGM